MLTLSEVTDVFRRRTRFFLQEDNVLKVVAKLYEDNSKVKFYIILGDEFIGDNDLERITLRYLRLFDELLNTYSFVISTKVNHLKFDASSYIILTKEVGFIGDYIIKK